MYEIPESAPHPVHQSQIMNYSINSEESQPKISLPDTPLKPHPCPRCSKRFNSLHQLAQHTRVHTGEKPFKCPFCERRFKQQSHVKQHTRLHTGEKPYKCPFCERRFKQQSHVKRHTRLHTGERPYKCSEPSCGRSFVQLSNLQQHMSNHSKEDVGKIKEPNFHCTICGKGFATQSSLVLHHEKKHQEMLLEPGVQKQPKHKPYVCGTCNKSYTTESALVIHSSKHKPLETPHHDSEATSSPPTDGSFLCTTCSESFISSEGLKEHKRVAHVNVAARPPVPYSPMPYAPPHGTHPHLNHLPLPPQIPWFDPHALAMTSAYPIPPPSPHPINSLHNTKR